jgi:predicted kinase
MNGISSIEKLRSYWTSWANGNINAVTTLLEMCPEFNELFTTPQSKSDHAEGSVGRHTILTCEAANQLASSIPSDQRKILRLAALLHDVGKPQCFIEAAPGIYSFPDANAHSFRRARILLDKYTQLSAKERETILALINNHYTPLWLVQNNMPLRILYKLSLECNLKILYHLTKANYIGRQTTYLRQKFEEIEAFKNICIDKNLWDGKNWPGLLHYSQYRRYGKNSEIARSIIDWFYLNGEIANTHEAIDWLSANRNEWKWGNLYMTVGPPGSGKSSWIEKNYSMLPVISSDQLRVEITGDITNQSENENVFKIAHSRIREILHGGKKVVYDATNLKADDRKTVIDIARRNGAQVTVFFFGTKYDNCLARVKNRPVLPLTRDILDEKYSTFDYVAPYEYDKIFYI